MSPKIALFLCVLFILFLLKLDFKSKPNVSIALWIPLIWLLIISSRMVYLWFYQHSEADLESNFVDPTIFSALMVAGLFILLRRKISWSDTLRRNAWVFIYFAYFGISIAWSDFPDIAFKRYIKAIGSLIMVLIILTEPAPAEAIKTIIRRCSYVLIPLSVILYKYYPHLGRLYHRWTGELMITGVTTNKNSLGVLCMVSSIIFISYLLTIWRNKKPFNNINKKEAFPQFLVFLMALWMLIISNSATAFVCFIVGSTILVGMKLSFIERNLKSFMYYIVFIICGFLTLQLTFDVTQAIIGTLGRDTTLTGRTEIWKSAIGMITNPLIGTGFESFWLGERAQIIGANYWFNLNEAHSGYVEVYLDGGLIGLFLLIVIIVNTFKNINNELLSQLEYGKLIIVLFIVALAHNITESSFRPLQLMGFIFFLSVVKRPQLISVSTQGVEANSMEKCS